MDQDNKRKDKKDGGGIFTWLIIAVAVLGFLGDAGIDIAGLIVGVVVIGVTAVIIITLSKKVRPSRGADSTGAEYARPERREHGGAAVRSISKMFTQAAKDAELEECDDEHYISASPEERRKTQLTQFYKSGIISREEYLLMRDRWNI